MDDPIASSAFQVQFRAIHQTKLDDLRRQTVARRLHLFPGLLGCTMFGSEPNKVNSQPPKKAVAFVTGWKPCFRLKPARWFPHQAGFKT